MPAIITFAHQKGGVGKTTLALNLWAFLNKQGVRCAAMDADVQGSLTRLSQLMKGRGVFEAAEVIPFTTDQKILASYSVVIIDTPPYLSNLLPSIFDMTDLIVIPCQASPMDALAIGSSVALAREAMARRPHLKAAIVLNRVDIRTSFVEEILPIIEQNGLPILKSHISNRIAYQRATLLYGSVLDGDDPKARNEIGELANEVISLLTQLPTQVN